DRVLTPQEVSLLAGKSPLFGDHRAKLIINSGSETGERAVELRATVPEATRLAVIDTEPPGLGVTVDGAPVSGTAAFAVRSNVSAAATTEWAEGSLHTLSAPATATAKDDNGNTIQYLFTGWTHGGPAAQTIAATFTGSPLRARYEAVSVNPTSF